jgi:hypothetical protein
LCPEALIEALQERRDEAAGRGVDVDRHVGGAWRGGQGVERGGEVGHRLVGAVHRRAHDRDDADRVLIAQRGGLGDAQVVPARHHGDEPGLDVPVPAELLPADLDVAAHDEVRPGRVQAGRTALGAPPPQQRHAAEHARLARPGGRAADRLLVRGVPQVPEDVHAAVLELGGLRVLVLVDHVLGRALGHELFGLRLHPCRDERGQVQPGVSVENELVPDDLQRGARQGAVLRQPEPGNLAAFLTEVHRVDIQLGARRLFFGHPPVQRSHGARLVARP